MFSHTLITFVFSFLIWQQVSAQSPSFIRGADISNVVRTEEADGGFRSDGIDADPLALLSEAGINMARLRLWHSPEGGYHNTDYSLELALRAKEAGMMLLLDFHYSDTWADPGKQFKPAAWTNLDFATLKDSLYAYTYATISRFNAAGAQPEIVQLGNEIIQGMLWDDGKVGGSLDNPAQWNQLAQLLEVAKQAVYDASDNSNPEIMIHLDRGADLPGTQWFFDNLTEQGFEFDLIGQSYYPWWHGSLSNLENNLRATVARYNKPVVLVEVAYPWTLQWFDNTNNIIGSTDQLLSGFPATPAGQADYIQALWDIVASVDAVHGLVYWEPAWIAAPAFGSPWENLSLFDNRGEPLPGLEALGGTASGTQTEAIDRAEPAVPELFPTQFIDKITIKYSRGFSRTASLTLSDVLGRVVLTQPLTESAREVHINLPSLPPGLYLAKILDGPFQSTHILTHTP